MTTVSGVIRNRDGDIFLPQTDAALVSGLSTVATSGSYTDLNNKPTLATVATSGSYNDLSNKPDLTGFITNSVNNLTNYYLKTETYTQTEIQNLIGAINQFSYQIAASTSAVSTPASNVLYLIGPTGSGEDKYEEYVYANSTWTKIGDTSVDLSGYVTTTALNTALADYALSSTIPTALSDLTDDSTHRTVTDTEKGQWMPRIYIGTCGTSAGTVNKIVTVESFPLDGNGKPLVGTMIGVKFTNTNSATAPKLNVNETGATSIWYNSDTASSTSANYGGSAARYCFYVWDGTYWVWVTHGTDNNDNTLAYNVRYNSASKTTIDKFARYRILFTSADDAHWVPANTSTSTNATASRTVNQTPINPFGQIVYYGSTTAISAGGTPGASVLYTQYALTFGYSFNRTGAALTLTTKAPVYIKCAPQSNGSAIIDADTPYVQALPSTEDGKIYIYLGIASSATAVEMSIVHPVYYYKDGAIRLWTNPAASGAYHSYTVGDFWSISDSILNSLEVGDTVIQDLGLIGSSGELLGTVTFCNDDYKAITAYDPSNGYYLYEYSYDSSLEEWSCSASSFPLNTIVDKADKVSVAVDGNLAGLDSYGNLTDSGYSPSSFATSAQGTKADNAVLYTQQSLTTAQKAQARTNIAAQGLHEGATSGVTNPQEGDICIYTELGWVSISPTYTELHNPSRDYTSRMYDVSSYTGRLRISAFDYELYWYDTNDESYDVEHGATVPIIIPAGEAVTVQVVSYGDELPTLTIEEEQEITNNKEYYNGAWRDRAYELSTNKVTSISSSSTDTQYPSAKCVYDSLAEKQNTIDASHKLDYGLLSNTPTIPAAQVNSDWNASSGVAQILNKPTLQQVYDGNVPDPSTWLDVVNPGDIVRYDLGSFYIITRIQRGSGAGDTNSVVELGGIDASGSGIYVGGTVATKSNGTWSFAFKSSNVDTIILTTQTAGGMLPNVMYNLGTLTGTVTFSLASPTDNEIVNHYYWTFTAGSTAPTITWPSGITWASGSAPIVTAGDYYEISVYNGIAMFMNVTPSS